MTLDWWTLGFQTINVVVLIWLLSRFLFQPVRQIIVERQIAAQAVLDEAEAARKEASEAKDAAQAKEAEIASGQSGLLARARQEADAEKTRLISEARAEVERLRARADAEAKSVLAKEARRLEAEAAELASDIAARVLARLPGTVRDAEFVDGLVAAVAELPEAARREIRDRPLTNVRAAHGLTDEETSDLSQRLAAVLGQAPALEIETDPTLLAGLELRTPHGIVHNNLRADLDRIHAELVDHE